MRLGDHNLIGRLKKKKMNHTIKKTLVKIFQETHLKWVQALPIALLQVMVVPRSGFILSPFEIVYGRRFQVSVSETTPLEWDSKIKQYVQHLGQILTTLQEFAYCRSIFPSDKLSHSF